MIVRLGLLSLMGVLSPIGVVVLLSMPLVRETNLVLKGYKWHIHHTKAPNWYLQELIWTTRQELVWKEAQLYCPTSKQEPKGVQLLGDCQNSMGVKGFPLMVFINHKW